MVTPQASETNAPIYLAIIGLFTGQQLLATVLSPVARASGLTEVQVGTIWAASSLMFVVMSPVWGRITERLGVRCVLLLSLFGSAGALMGFALLASAATRGRLEPATVYPLMIVVRSLLFGFFGSATPVAAQTFIASSTGNEKSRIRGLAGIGASFAIAGAMGPAVGGALASRSVLAPLYGSAVVVLTAAIIVWCTVPKSQGPRAALATGAGGSPRSAGVALLIRVLPCLMVGLGLWLTSSLHSVVLSFVLQDRLGLDAGRTGKLTGIAFAVAGIGSSAVQLGLLRVVTLTPRTMIIIGVGLAASGFTVLVFAQAAAVIVLGTALIAVGLAFAVPGYTTVTTMQVSQKSQSGLAGMMAANNSLGSVIAPVTATALYMVNGNAPYLFALVVLAVALVITVGSVGNQPDGDDADLVNREISGADGGVDSSTVVR